MDSTNHETQKFGDYAVSTDGTTVWVNGPKGCVARYNTKGQAVFRAREDLVFGKSFKVNETPTWQTFCNLVQRECDFDVPASFEPKVSP